MAEATDATTASSTATTIASIEKVTPPKKSRQRPDDDDDDDENDVDRRQKRQRPDDDDDYDAAVAFGECAKKFVVSLHKCFIAADDCDDESKFDKLLTDLKSASLHRGIPWRTFWRDVYGSMCNIAHFFNVPSVHFHAADLRLFCTDYLRSIERVVTERHAAASDDARPQRQQQSLATERDDDDAGVTMMRNGGGAGGGGGLSTMNSQRQQREERRENDIVYERAWTRMNRVATLYSEIIWLALERHLIEESSRELQDYLEAIYERAMLGGHALLAAPLSQFAPLRIVQLHNDAILRKLTIAVKRNYGLVFNSTIVPTISAALQYSVIARGVRPIDLWPFGRDWPTFIRNHTALMSHYVLTGLINDEVMLVSNGETGIRRRSNYIETYEMKHESLSSAVGLGPTDNEYRAIDLEETKYIAACLNLRKKCLDRKITVPADECYYCHRRLFRRRRRRYYRFDSEDDDEDEDDYTIGNDEDDDEEYERAVAAAAVQVPQPPIEQLLQCNDVSSTTPDTTATAASTTDSHLPVCTFIDVKNGDFAIEDKNAMINRSNYFNLLILDARSSELAALLRYQAHGLCCFPSNYDRNLHLKLLRHIYKNYTTRLIRQPLPSTLSNIVTMFFIDL